MIKFTFGGVKVKTVQRTKENLFKCMCKGCPSYAFACKVMAVPGNILLLIDPLDDNKLHAETMFCAYHKSQCITEGKGCKCPECEVYKEYALEKTYYCTSEGGK